MPAQSCGRVVASSLPICPICNLSLVPLVWGLRPWFGRAEATSFADRTWAELGLAPGAGILARHPGRPQEIAFLFDIDSLATGMRLFGDKKGHCDATRRLSINGGMPLQHSTGIA